VQDTPRRLPLAGPPRRKLIMNAVPSSSTGPGHRCVSVGTYAVRSGADRRWTGERRRRPWPPGV